jgi:hypothetical protein
MQLETFYEWVAEPVNKDGDIIDPLFNDRLEDALATELIDWPEAVRVDIALVKRRGSESTGEVYRQYAYLAEGALNDTFPDGTIVPKQCHTIAAREWRAIKRTAQNEH